MNNNITRDQVIESDSKIIKNQVMNKLDDHIIRHQVMGIGGGGSSAVLEPLTVTSNGEYTPGEGVDGFSSVNVNVQGLPDEELICNIIFDYENNRVFDTKRSFVISQKSGTITSDNKFVTAGNSYIYPLVGLMDNVSYRFEFDIDSINSSEVDRGNVLANFSPSSGSDNVYFGWDGRSDQQTFYSYGSSGYNYPNEKIPMNAFDGKTLKIYYNAIYMNGKWWKKTGSSNFNVFRIFNDDLESIIEFGRSGNANAPQNFTIGRPSNSLDGVTYSAIRVYQLNNLEIEGA